MALPNYQQAKRSSSGGRFVFEAHTKQTAKNLTSLFSILAPGLVRFHGVVGPNLEFSTSLKKFFANCLINPRAEDESKVMKLNHLHLMVTEVLPASAFLETYFGLQRRGGNAGLVVLSDDDGFMLTLMKVGKEGSAGYPTNFHVGFFVESEAKVDAVYNRLKENGFEVAPPERFQHSYSFYIEAPGGFTVEVGA